MEPAVYFSLHFPCVGSVALTGSYFGRGNSPILISYIWCDGEESYLEECSYNYESVYDDYYFMYAVVGVICQGNTTSETECSSGDLHFVGGESESEGRVEVCVDGFWGTVCDQNWSQREAMTVCRQAGLPSSGTYVVQDFKVLLSKNLLKRLEPQTKGVSVHRFRASAGCIVWRGEWPSCKYQLQYRKGVGTWRMYIKFISYQLSS